MEKKKYDKTVFKTFLSKPANYILWYSNGDYYVSNKKGPKREYFTLEHFVSFFKNESDAWKCAAQRTKIKIIDLEKDFKNYNKRAKERK